MTTTLKKTKIVATLGPASFDEHTIAALVEEGVNVFRLNMSHGSVEQNKRVARTIRQVAQDKGLPIGILVDLQGPKLRIGRFIDGKVTLSCGGLFRLDLVPEPGNEKRVYIQQPEVFKALNEGSKILLDDGKLVLKVVQCGEEWADCTIEVGGILSDHKGITVPNSEIPLPAMTSKDVGDLELVKEIDAEWVALSFVQRPEDIVSCKKLLKSRAKVIAKIEKPAALSCVDDIMDVADGIMVARGDLGVEEPAENVPGIQRKLISKARKRGIPVIVATQMLESMIHSPVPTRAEVSDVANAVYSGADAIMLSAETAAGQYPVDAVRTMAKVAIRAEAEFFDQAPSQLSALQSNYSAIPAAAGLIARIMSSLAIVAFTTTGATALRVARQRPEVLVLVLAPDAYIARQLSIAWGIYAVSSGSAQSFEDLVSEAKKQAKRYVSIPPDSNIVVVAGMPFGKAGSTNLVHVVPLHKDA